MNLNSIKSSLVNLEILNCIDQKKTCSTKELLKIFKGKIVRRTLYSNLEKWDLEESIIIRDGFDSQKARYSHYTIKTTLKLTHFLQNHIYTTPIMINELNKKKEKTDSDEDVQLMNEIEDIYKDISIPQILILIEENDLNNLADQILAILKEGFEKLFFKRMVNDSMKIFEIAENI